MLRVLLPNSEKVDSLNLNPAIGEFAQDLPAAGRCKAEGAQAYFGISSP